MGKAPRAKVYSVKSPLSFWVNFVENLILKDKG
jgi:hypothetical protein